MIIQRLSFRAAKGHLRVIAVWRCLVKSGAKIYRWNMGVDRETGVESMTVDVVDSGSLRTDDIAAMLGAIPLELTITVFHMSVVSDTVAAHDADEEADESVVPFPAVRTDAPLALVTDITRRASPLKRD